MGVVCGAIALAGVLVILALTDKEEPEEETEEETEEEHKPSELEREAKRTAKLIERAAVRDKIATFSAMGYSQRQIAEMLGMHQKSVWRIMKRYGIKKA